MDCRIYATEYNERPHVHMQSVGDISENSCSSSFTKSSHFYIWAGHPYPNKKIYVLLIQPESQSLTTGPLKIPIFCLSRILSFLKFNHFLLFLRSVQYTKISKIRFFSYLKLIQEHRQTQRQQMFPKT